MTHEFDGEAFSELSQDREISASPSNPIAGHDQYRCAEEAKEQLSCASNPTPDELARLITNILIDLGLGSSGSYVGDAKIAPLESVVAERKAA